MIVSVFSKIFTLYPERYLYFSKIFISAGSDLFAFSEKAITSSAKSPILCSVPFTITPSSSSF